MYMLFFLNDTATTEIYTYGHTLSLHDALPIFSGRRLSGSSPAKRLRITSLRTTRAPGGRPIRPPRRRARLLLPVPDSPPTATSLRSEEHTSELQSLMRISYAVFCLKKKYIIYHHYLSILI